MSLDRVLLRSAIVTCLLMLVFYSVVPASALVLLAAVPAGLWASRKQRARRVRRDRAANNLCLYCGYGLTGNESGTCSECGMPAGPLWLRLRRERRAEQERQPPPGRVARARAALARWFRRRKED